MRAKLHQELENGRIKAGPYATRPGEPYGAFQVKKKPSVNWLNVLVCDGTGWAEAGLSGLPFEHVSVSVLGQNRCPTWEEMAWVKSLCWDDEECVIQYHPPRSVHVNYHSTTLHLWKPIGFEIPLPDPQAVGPVAETPF